MQKSPHWIVPGIQAPVCPESDIRENMSKDVGQELQARVLGQDGYFRGRMACKSCVTCIQCMCEVRWGCLMGLARNSQEAGMKSDMVALCFDWPQARPNSEAWSKFRSIISRHWPTCVLQQLFKKLPASKINDVVNGDRSHSDSSMKLKLSLKAMHTPFS